MDTKELVERLRNRIQIATWYEGGLRHVSEINPDGPEAADAIERLERERDEALATARMYEATAKEAAKGLEYFSDIDEAWDAFGTRGNRKALTLAEQISSLNHELDAAEAEAATLRARVARLEDSDRDWGRLHQQVIEERAAALLRIERLEEALVRIAGRTQTEGLLWWQVEARAALKDTTP